MSVFSLFFFLKNNGLNILKFENLFLTLLELQGREYAFAK